MRFAIVGVGLIGGSLGLALKARGFAVSGVEKVASARQMAVTLGAVDTATDNLAEGVADADVIVLAMPIGVCIALLPHLRERIRPDAIVTDVCSTKGEIALAGSRAFPDGRFVASHPMAGSHHSGVSAAKADLFMNATWAITPTENTLPEAIERVANMATSVGGRVVMVDPNAHDRAVALTSHFPHVLAYTVMTQAVALAKDTPHLFELSAGSFASMTRVAASSPELWQGITLSNREALAATLRKLASTLTDVAEELEQNNAEAILRRYQAGHEAKQSVTRT